MIGSMRCIIYFLHFALFTFNIYILCRLYLDLIYNNLFWRNTKDSVKDECTIPGVVEDLILINFSGVERALYKIYQSLPVPRYLQPGMFTTSI